MVDFFGADIVRRRGVAQPGSALRSGRRGRRFESGHPDKKTAWFEPRGFFVFNLIRAPLGNLIHQRQNPFQIFRSEDVLLATKVAVDHRLSFGLENTLQLLAT